MNNCESEEIVEAANIAIALTAYEAQYSMVKSCLIIYDNIDISKFPKLIAFLKRTGDGYQAKKSKILTE
ncbi:hypothetical protein NQ317_008866 [Molorchus minor]|uniref:Uncharacterized protein n=1 Tax=Molorchus minor TaxID=1323400 RepID=A0ABQ9IUG5_9CUCU|nr:hypothetical protein NQ317_008866 [Molorchus minor]